MPVAAVVALAVLGALSISALILALWSSMVKLYFREKRNHLREMLVSGTREREEKDVKLER